MKVLAFANLHHFTTTSQNSLIKYKASNVSSKPSILTLPVFKNISTSSPKLAGHSKHDHSKLWSLERLMSLVLLPLVPAALVYPCQALDTALAVLIVMHTHL